MRGNPGAGAEGIFPSTGNLGDTRKRRGRLALAFFPSPVMSTEIAQTDTDLATREAVERAVSLLRSGEVVALPTETVYGLGADAFNAEAVAKIYETKERPGFDPLIVHIEGKRALDTVASVPPDISRTVIQLVETFWPGPLTLILPKTDAVPDIVTAGLPTVAVRMSAHPVFKRVVRGLGHPIAAPSANRFGRISPTSALAVRDELDGRVPLIVDGGACSRGLESTIVRVEAGDPKPRLVILRAGPVTVEDLKPFGKPEIAEHNEAVENNAPEAPGMLASHYAPRTPLRLVAGPAEFRPETGKRYALLSYRGQEKDGFLGLADWDEVFVLSPGSGKLPEAGIRFFHLLRQLDQLPVDEIIAEPVPERGIGLAILDRLRKASARS